MLSKEKILQDIVPIFITVFGTADFINEENVDARSVDDWNSLRHMMLMTEIENKFHITLAPLDILEGKSLKGIINIIQKHCNKE